MINSSKIQDGLIMSLASPVGVSALAIIRCSGAACVETLAASFSRPKALNAAQGKQMVYGMLLDQTGLVLDEVLCAVFRQPASYTGEEMVEISAHGSPAGVEAICQHLLRIGFRQAQGGEFTLRAFINGKLDLSRAEAVNEVIAAQTRKAHALAMHRLGGAVERTINLHKKALTQLMAMVSIQLDYPEEEIEEIHLPLNIIQGERDALDALAQTYKSGKIYQQGVRIALAGRTNAGKSSLFNVLVREERAIVSDIHGTTRDWIEAPYSLDGIPIRLFDTAGLRQAREWVEQEGIRRSGMVIENAGLIIYVVDGCVGLDAEELDFLEQLKQKKQTAIVVWSKSDAAGWKAPEPARLFGHELVALSTQTLAGLNELLKSLTLNIGAELSSEDNEVLIDSQRQHLLLQQAVASLDQVMEAVEANLSMDLIALDLQNALQALGEITGEVSNEDVLDVVFGNFCVGK